MSDPFVAMIEDLANSEMASESVYTPLSGPQQPVRVLLEEVDAMNELGQTVVRQVALFLEVLRSELVAAPKVNETFTLVEDGREFKVRDLPQTDALRLLWRMPVSLVGAP